MSNTIEIREKIEALQAEQRRLETQEAERRKGEAIVEASSRLRQARQELTRIGDAALPVEDEVTFAWQRLAELLSRLQSLRRAYDQAASDAASAEARLRDLGVAPRAFASRAPRIPAPSPTLLRWALTVDVALVQAWAGRWRAGRGDAETSSQE